MTDDFDGGFDSFCLNVGRWVVLTPVVLVIMSALGFSLEFLGKLLNRIPYPFDRRRPSTASAPRTDETTDSCSQRP
jgi:hypothetical protein